MKPLSTTVLECVARLRDLPAESAETGVVFVDVDGVLRVADDLEHAARKAMEER